MNEEMTQQLMTTAEKLANAAEALDRVLGKLDSQQEALNANRRNCRLGSRNWKKLTPN